MPNKITCPACANNRVVRNGRTMHGVQNYKCRGCGRQFVQRPAGRVPDKVMAIIDKMLNADFAVRRISELTLVSRGAIYARRRILNG